MGLYQPAYLESPRYSLKPSLAYIGLEFDRRCLKHREASLELLYYLIIVSFISFFFGYYVNYRC
jgi:hypothetical protein